MPHSGVFVSGLSATKTRSHLLKLPSAVPLDLLILRIFLVVLCIFSFLFYAGLVRAPPASVGVFPPQGPARLSRKLPEFFVAGHCVFQRIGRELFFLLWRAVQPAICGKALMKRSMSLASVQCMEWTFNWNLVSIVRQLCRVLFAVPW